jgi:hypothetical protein
VISYVCFNSFKPKSTRHCEDSRQAALNLQKKFSSRIRSNLPRIQTGIASTIAKTLLYTNLKSQRRWFRNDVPLFIFVHHINSIKSVNHITQPDEHFLCNRTGFIYFSDQRYQHFHLFFLNIRFLRKLLYKFFIQ